MKKLLLLFSAFALIATMTACGGNGNSETTNGSSTTPPVSSESTSAPETATSAGEATANTGSLAECLAQFGLTEADITPENLAEMTPTILDKEFVRVDISANAMPEADTIQAFVAQVYNSTKNAADDEKIYVSQDKNDLENIRPMIEFTLDGADFSKSGKTRWGYDHNGTRYYVSLSFEYKSREVTAFNLQIKYDWY
jgi:predicted small lipoprotein YifL